METRYHIFRRQDKKTGDFYYCARFLNDIGKPVRYVSFREAKTKEEGIRQAERLLAREGKTLTSGDNPEIIPFIKNFWTWDSLYVQGKIARGDSISRPYVRSMRAIFTRHLAPHLRGTTLRSLNDDLLEWALLQVSRSGASARTVNQALQSIRVPINHHCRRRRIPSPISFVGRFKETPKRRGVLKPAEIRKIAQVKETPAVKAAVLLGLFCGLRLGECRGLQDGDIDFENHLLNIQHNLPTNSREVTTPKWESLRIVPMPGVVEEALRLAIATRPHDGPFVVWNTVNPENGIQNQTLRKGFQRMLRAIGITEEEEKNRNIVFHSLRHSYVSLTRAAGIPDFIVQKLAGHRSAAMMENYSHGEIIDFQAARKMLENGIAGEG